MQSANGSEVFAFRESTSPLTGDFLLGHRYRTQCVEHYRPVPNSVKPHSLISQRTLPTARDKRSTDSESNFLMNKARTLQNNELQHFQHQSIYGTAVEISQAEVHLPFFKSTTRETAVAGSFVCKVRQFSATARSVTGANTAPTLSSKTSHCRSADTFASKPNTTIKPLRFLSPNVVDSVEQNRCLNSIGPRKSRVQIKVPPVKAPKSRGAENNSSYGSPATSFSASSLVPRTALPFPSFFDVDDADLSPTLVKVVDSAQSRLDPFSADPSSSSTSFSDFLPSFDALDELARWDMASFSSSQFSTDDPGLEQTDDDRSPSAKKAGGSNHPPPFSTPFGDDDLLENELPFPSVRPRILMENMGVKKSKTVAADKARNLTGSSSGLGFTSSMSRSEALFLRNEASSSKAAASFPRDPPALSLPPNLPSPLPKPQSANSPSPLNDDSLARTSTYLQNSPSPPASSTRRQSPIPQTFKPTLSLDQDSGPLIAYSSASASDIGDEPMKSARHRQSKKQFTLSGTKKDSNGCHHIGPEDCELFIEFPQTNHYEFWDMSDNGWVQVPALLCLMTKDPRRWTTTPLAVPDVSLIDLQCEDFALPVPFPSLYLPWSVPSGPTSSFSPTSPSLSPSPNTYSTKFLGGKSAFDERSVGSGERSKRRRMSMMGSLKKLEEEQTMRPDKISLDGKWVRTHSWPGVEGCRRHRREPGQATSHGNSSRPTSANPPRGWYLKFWIPIPTRLFMKRETRIFRICAKVWMTRNEESVVQPDRFETEGLDVDSGENEEDEEASLLLAETQMTVSHLRREREMDVW